MVWRAASVHPCTLMKNLKRDSSTFDLDDDTFVHFISLNPDLNPHLQSRVLKK